MVAVWVAFFSEYCANGKIAYQTEKQGMEMLKVRSFYPWCNFCGDDPD